MLHALWAKVYKRYNVNNAFRQLFKCGLVNYKCLAVEKSEFWFSLCAVTPVTGPLVGLWEHHCLWGCTRDNWFLRHEARARSCTCSVCILSLCTWAVCCMVDWRAPTKEEELMLPAACDSLICFSKVCAKWPMVSWESVSSCWPKKIPLVGFVLL